jgi:cytoskeletal protein CcmA (bactofilin family)
MMHSRSSNARISRAPMFGNSRGAALMSALLVMAVLTILGMTAITTTSLGSKIAGNYRTASQAFYTAEAGLRRAAGQLKADPLWVATLGDTNDAFSGDSTLGDSTYVVAAFQDDPNPGEVRVRSTGTVTGASGASATVEAVVNPGLPGFPIFDFGLFACGNIHMNDGVSNVINSDVFAAGNIHLDAHQIQGNVSATGNVHIDNASFIVGDVSGNGDIQLDSTAEPNVDGNVTVTGPISGAGVVSGTTTTSPNPVIDACLGANLDAIRITPAQIQDFRDHADTTLGSYTVNNGDTVTYTDIVHITGDFTLTGNATFSDNVVFIVDGDINLGGNLTSSPPGASVTFVTESNLHTDNGGGSVVLDGAMHVGGNLHVENGTSLTVNGSVIALGNIHASSGGPFNVNYQPSNDPNIAGQAFAVKHWRIVYN